jgi:ligand-binding sensor domain-containing protein/signal transduction histidine kinase
LIIITLILLFIFPFSLSAQEEKMEFQHVSYDFNLPHNAINVIYQDKAGFLWLGTKTGLHLFDGYKFITFRRSTKENSLSNDNVKVIYEDSKNNLWVGTFGGLNKYDRDEQNFIRYRNKKDDKNSICWNIINAIAEDKFGNLWIATDKGLSRYDGNQDKFFNYHHDKNDIKSISSDTIRSLYTDSDGNLWLGTVDLTIDKININETFSGNSNHENNQLFITHYYLKSERKPREIGGIISRIYRTSDNIFWIGTEGKGLFNFKIDDPNNHLTSYGIILNADNFLNNNLKENSLSNNIIRNLIEDPDGRLWICTYGGGINIYEKGKEGFRNIQNDPENSRSLSNNYALSIFIDRNNNIWIGCATGGLNKYDPKKFYVYKSDPKNKASLKNDVVTSMYIDKEGILWVGTRDGGLNVLDRKNNTCINYIHDPDNPQSLLHTNVRAVCEDYNERIWAGMLRGLSCFDKKTKKFIKYNEELSNLLSKTLVRALYIDSKNNLWIGSQNGTIKYNLKENKFVRFINDTANRNSISDNYTWAFYEDKSGNMWIGTIKGINRYIEAKGIFKRYILDNERTRNDQVIFGDENLIVSITQDHDGILWLATMNGGLHKIIPKQNYNPQNPNDDPYELQEFNLPLINNIGTNGILIDDKNNVWVGSDIGVIRIYPNRLNWRLYDMKDGVTANEFITGSCYQSANGEFFFGGNAGMVRFFPNSFRENKSIPAVVITAIKISNIERYSGTKAAGLKELNLNYTDKILSFEFSVLDFSDIPKNKYKYKLEGFDKDWINSDDKNEVTYMNLKGGDYVFHVIGCNSDGFWSEAGATIRIHIDPPFWENWWFIVIVILVIGCLIYLFIRIRLKNSENQKKILEEQVKIRTEDLRKANQLLEDEVIERKQIEQDILRTNNLLQESNTTKDKLFSIISHDLRGPIGNLSGMLKVFKEEKDMDPVFRDEFLTSMSNSADSTYALLENLLDWARTQKDSINLKVENIPLSLIIDEILSFLSGIASKKSISIISHVDENTYAYCDHNTIATVIRNLVSNALKFTPENGKVELFAVEDGEKIKVTIKDSGIGIKPEALQNIFNKEKVVSTKGTSGEKGTGLGLLLVKEFVRKNNGIIWAESELGKGTSFHFTLPKPIAVES